MGCLRFPCDFVGSVVDSDVDVTCFLLVVFVVIVVIVVVVVVDKNYDDKNHNIYI